MTSSVPRRPRTRLPVPRRWRTPIAGGRTIRLRLTVLYTTVYGLTAAALLTIAYLLVRSNIRTRQNLRAALEHHGLHPSSNGPLGFPAGSPQARLVHVVEAQIINGALHRLLIEYIVALVALSAISVVAGWLLAGRALAPLRAITATARRVSGENLGERIALTGPHDELRELADTFDGMLARLDAAFASQRRFVANASHELRTPLAIMRTEIDVALSDPDASRDELRTMGEAIREMVDRCERLIASLLLLARSEATAGAREPVDLAELAGDCITDLRARAQDAHIQVTAELAPAWVTADPGLLERLIANLLDNGIHHNEPGGVLTVVTGTDGGRARLRVANGGAVIEPAQAALLAEPFRRLSRSGDGFGLGLSIVRTIAEAHHGSMSIVAPPWGGLEVVVELPAQRGGRAARVTEPPSVNSQDRLTKS